MDDEQESASIDEKKALLSIIGATTTNIILKYMLHTNIPTPDSRICGGVEPKILYATIRALKRSRDNKQAEIKQLQDKLAELRLRNEEQQTKISKMRDFIQQINDLVQS